MQSFNVINYNINKQKFEAYDIMSYLIKCYKEEKKKPKTFEELKQFVKEKSMHQFWARCEYEIILVDWPGQKIEEKWDIYDQIMMNLDTITDIVMKECTEKKKRGDAAVAIKSHKLKVSSSNLLPATTGFSSVG